MQKLPTNHQSESAGKKYNIFFSTDKKVCFKCRSADHSEKNCTQVPDSQEYMVTEDNEEEEEDTASTYIIEQCKPSKLVDIAANQSDSTESAPPAVPSAATSTDQMKQTDSSPINQIPTLDSSSNIDPINKSLLPLFSSAASQKKPIPVNAD